MITKIDTKTAERLLSNAKDIFSVKIYTNLKAYSECDFFSVYAGQGVLIGRYYNDLIVRTKGVISDDTIEELSLFLKVCGFETAMCGIETGKRLSATGWSKTEECLVCKFSSALAPADGIIPEMEEIEVNPRLDDVFEIIKDGFPEMVFDEWYTDMNHKIRHSTATVYRYKGATASVLADINGTVYVSFVCSKKEERGQGYVKGLIRRLGIHYENQGKELCLICHKELSNFYAKMGFYEGGKVMFVYNEG